MITLQKHCFLVYFLTVIIIDSATGTLIFIFLMVILKTLPERCFLVQFLIARARVCVCVHAYVCAFL